MNSAWTRLNAIFTFSLCVLALLTFCCFVSTCLNDYTSATLTPIKLNADKISVSLLSDFTGNGEPADLGFLTLNIKADLNPLFNWNVKQLFIYVIAEYTSEQNVINQVILWDKIIERDIYNTKKAIIDIKNLKPKYYVWDDGVGGLKGNENVTLNMYWNIIPNTGPIFTSGLNLDTNSPKNIIRFPHSYATTRH
ncbi:unnamed protein product [Gordionus sp. m RMFG-2023]|uniref:signal peptidase complex subunit 3-like n=1 Tax=Gordionus sp. m RMFG-2023 TaxID=3053472 RepID=UPI0030E55261